MNKQEKERDDEEMREGVEERGKKKCFQLNEIESIDRKMMSD
jgi:hypothetical protein